MDPVISVLLLVVVSVLTVTAIAVYKRRCKETCIFTVLPVSEKYDWRLTEPKNYRPMKPVYHMVMNVGKVSPEDWLHIDSDYSMVTSLHTNILDGVPDLTCKANPSSDTLKAVQELYDMVLSVLLQRYPQYFVEKGNYVRNTIRNIDIPRKAAKSSLGSEQLLRILMENTEEDFQLLQYDSSSGEYVIRAIGGLTSDGFVWKSKLNKKLTDVHLPVPGYAEKLKVSMNRFFSRLQPGSIVQRFTWGIHLGSRNQKFHPVKHYTGSGVNGEIDRRDIDFEHGAWLRVERQVPMKLPTTGFLILSQHTYWYPLTALKKEGIATLTADSIESWPQEFAYYKGRHEWCNAVCSWLREEDCDFK